MGKVLIAIIILLPWTLPLIPEGIFKGLIVMTWFLAAIACVMIFADIVTSHIIKDTRRKWDRK